jgi:hypothetical protein
MRSIIVRLTNKLRIKTMFKTKATVNVKGNDGKVKSSQEYEKAVFHGTHVDADGNVQIQPLPGKTLDETMAELLTQALAYAQTRTKEGKGNPVVELLERYTYADDLDVRSKIRASLVAASEGPDKAIDKMVKDFMAGRLAVGKPVTEEFARKRVMLMMGEDSEGVAA